MSTQTATKAEARAPGDAAAGIARNAFNLVLGQVATTALAIVMSAALGRSLGAADFGLYFLVLTMSTFAFVFADWGQMLIVVRDIAREPGRSGVLLGSSQALRIAGAVIVCAPVLLVAIGLGYDARTCTYAVVMIASSLPFFIAQGIGYAFRGRDCMGLDATVSVVNKAVTVALMLGLLWAGAGIPGVMGAQALAGIVAIVVATRLYRRLGADRLSFSRDESRRLLGEGAAIVVMTVAMAVQPYLDAIVLARLAPATSVGWYGAAKNVMGTLYAPAVIVAGASYPRLSRAAGDAASFRHEMRTALRPLLWLGALGGVGTYVFADFAINLIYGAKGFGPAGTVLQVFGVAVPLLFTDTLLGASITAAGRAKGFAVVKIVSVLISTGLDVWLIPIFERRFGNGGMAIVVAFAASELVVFSGALYLLPRRSLDARALLDVGRALGSAAVTFALFRALPAMTPWLGIPVCVAVFVAASLLLGLVTREDVAMLRQVVARKLGPRGA